MLNIGGDEQAQWRRYKHGAGGLDLATPQFPGSEPQALTLDKCLEADNEKERAEQPPSLLR